MFLSALRQALTSVHHSRQIIKTDKQMKNIKTILIILGLLFLKLHLVAQIPNYTGTWVLHNEKSKIQSRPDGMTSAVFIIKQVGNEFSLTIHHIFGDKK